MLIFVIAINEAFFLEIVNKQLTKIVYGYIHYDSKDVGLKWLIWVSWENINYTKTYRSDHLIQISMVNDPVC